MVSKDSLLEEYEWVTTPYKELNLLNIYHSILDLLSGKQPSIDGLKDYVGVNKIVFIYLDGVGYDPFLKAVGGEIWKKPLKITSIYPSTTASVATSLGTGSPPEIHGVFEWNLYIPELNMLTEPLLMRPFHHRCNDELCEENIKPSIIIKSRRLFPRLLKQGVETKAFLRVYIAGSCYGRYILGGTDIFPYINVTDLSISLKRELNRDTKLGFYYVYIESMDSIGHLYGYEYEEYYIDIEYTVKILLNILSGLDEKVKDDTLFIFTSDHGMTNIPRKNLISLDKITPKLKKYLKRDKNGFPLVSGSPRNVYLHIRNGYIDKSLRLLESINKVAIIMEKREFLKTRMMKKIKYNVIGRLGEIILLPSPSYGIWMKHYPKETIKIVGMHSGLSKDEMYIPLLFGKLNELKG